MSTVLEDKLPASKILTLKLPAKVAEAARAAARRDMIPVNYFIRREVEEGLQRRGLLAPPEVN